LGTSVSRYHSETEAKSAKRALRIWGTMENTLCETGVDSGIRSQMPKSGNRTHGRAIPISYEPTGRIRSSRRKHPHASRKPGRQLTAIVNSLCECEELQCRLAELDRLFPSSSSSMKGGAAQSAVEKNMPKIVTIKGERVIDIYESFDGSYWFVTERRWKQDSLIGGKVYKNDQILFGYVRLSSCPQFAEFGNFSETELKLLGNWVWKVPQRNWPLCPEVEVQEIHEHRGNHGAPGAAAADVSVGPYRFGGRKADSQTAEFSAILPVRLAGDAAGNDRV